LDTLVDKRFNGKMYLFLKQSVNPAFLYTKFQTNNIKNHINYSNGIIRFFQISIIYSSDQHYNIINAQQINSITNSLDTYSGNLLILILHFCKKIINKENQISNLIEAFVNNRLLSFIMPNINMNNGTKTDNNRTTYPIVLQ
jgi:hypothetical protein